MFDFALTIKIRIVIILVLNAIFSLHNHFNWLQTFSFYQHVKELFVLLSLIP